jgi:transposase-like protein
MGFVEAGLDQVRTTLAGRWSLVKDPEEFWGDFSRHGRPLLKALLEGTLEAWRDPWVVVAWHPPAANRKTCRNGYYRRKRGATTLGPLERVRVPRCRDPGLTAHMFQRLARHDQALSQSAVDLLRAGGSTRRVGELLDQILDLPLSASQVSRLAKRLDADVRAYPLRPLADGYR